METIVTVGLDLAKSVFQVHAVDAYGNVVVRRTFRRANLLDFFRKTPRCLVGMEACATAHFWAREIQACGHNVKITPPIYRIRCPVCGSRRIETVPAWHTAQRPGMGH